MASITENTKKDGSITFRFRVSVKGVGDKFSCFYGQGELFRSWRGGSRIFIEFKKCTQIKIECTFL